jgi:hypothetical protein
MCKIALCSKSRIGGGVLMEKCKEKSYDTGPLTAQKFHTQQELIDVLLKQKHVRKACCQPIFERLVFNMFFSFYGKPQFLYK